MLMNGFGPFFKNNVDVDDDDNDDDDDDDDGPCWMFRPPFQSYPALWDQVAVDGTWRNTTHSRWRRKANPWGGLFKHRLVYTKCTMQRSEHGETGNHILVVSLLFP